MSISTRTLLPCMGFKTLDFSWTHSFTRLSPKRRCQQKPRPALECMTMLLRESPFDWSCKPDDGETAWRHTTEPQMWIRYMTLTSEISIQIFLGDPRRPTEVEHVREMSAKSRHQLKSPPEEEGKSLVKRKYQVSPSSKFAENTCW